MGLDGHEPKKPLSDDGAHVTSRGATIFALAIIVTVASLIPYLETCARFWRPWSVLRRQSWSRVPSPLAEHEQAGNEKVFESSASGSDDAYSGIVLWSKKQDLTPLVAPTPALGKYQMETGRRANPLVVPFNGVYWFFQAPYEHPPRGSREAHGSPELVTARSTDQLPLSMEAHQNLGVLIDLNCCTRIRVAIRNKDRYPETVSLELVLTDTSLLKRPSQSLGNVMVTSTRPWKLYGDRPAVIETLTFEMPPHSTINRLR